ncbi:kinesin-like protein KIN-7L [Hyalella azteca]|uniref:Kinesin-like protein KIN-7L n=1 Tax=Hyalella azteca TaxID=294128 RepID=A0A979FMX3_HYAAZ|nr:kinesin-like protein KIN-7L [Hyalella azteca]
MNRQVWPTPRNARSSRSHVIFRIRVEYTEAGSSDGGVAARGAHLLIVDLAGSEKMANTGSTKDETSNEGKNINLDLCFLKTAVTQLSRGSVATYRGNSLTPLLRGSLEGNVRLSILCTVDFSSANETRDTLSFASAARSEQRLAVPSVQGGTRRVSPRNLPASNDNYKVDNLHACPYCDKTCTTKGNLQAHIKSRHKEQYN